MDTYLGTYTMAIEPGYVIQEKQHDGKTYWVVPVVMMREGVHNGSHGPLLHRADDLGHFIESWNGIPVTVQHPQRDGKMVSANAPDILDSYSVGRVYGAHMDGDKLKGHAWIDPERLKVVSATAYQFIEKKQPLDVSVGVFTDEDLESGQWNLEKYDAVAKNHRPDHLALLPGKRGACSWEDGCGIRNNEDFVQENESNNNKGVNTMADEKKGCCPEKVELLIQDENSKFTEADRDWLLTMSEEQLEKVVPVVVTKEVEKHVQVNAEQALQVLKAEFSDMDKFMKLVPEKIRTQFAYGMKLHEDKRQTLIDYITTNSQVWTKEELGTMEVEMLDKLAKTCGAKRSFVGMAAGGGSPTTNSADEMLLPLGVTGK